MNSNQLSSNGDPVSGWIEEIKTLWAKGTTATIELARLVWTVRQRLAYGRWARALKSLPFGARKAKMLVAIGKGLAWADGQTFARLPSGWTILYYLAQLEPVVIEKLIAQGTIHPGLPLRAAKELVARFKGQSSKTTSNRNNVKQRTKRFVDFVRRTLKDWQPEERQMAIAELARLIEEIETAQRHGGFPASLSDDRVVLCT